MPLLEPFLYNGMWVFMVVLARVSPLLMMMPPLRGSSIPMRIRAMIALSMAAIMAPLVADTATALPSSLILLTTAIITELLLGLVLGMTASLLISSLQTAGQIVSHLAGMDMAEGTDPGDDTPMPVIAQLMGWLAVGIFMALGGHRDLLRCCLDSFQKFPAGGVTFQGEWLQYATYILFESLVLGIRIGAPMAVALLLANLITGLLARTVPQINILAIGFNINALVMLVMLFASIGGAGWIFQDDIANWLIDCQRVFELTPDQVAANS